METMEAISRQRAVRAFADRPVERERLERIVAAGRRAPSSKNSQRREFVVCQERERLRALSTVGDFAGHIAGAGAAIAIVTPRGEDPSTEWWIAFDAGHSAQNMMLAALDLGVGTVHAAVYDEMRARQLLGYPEDRRCDCLLSLGYPADPSLLEAPPARGGRRALGDVLHWERW